MNNIGAVKEILINFGTRTVTKESLDKVARQIDALYQPKIVRADGTEPSHKLPPDAGSRLIGSVKPQPDELISDEERTETAEVLYNFRNAMDIEGIKNVLWQRDKAQHAKDKAEIDELKSLLLETAIGVEEMRQEIRGKEAECQKRIEQVFEEIDNFIPLHAYEVYVDEIGKRQKKHLLATCMRCKFEALKAKIKEVSNG
jgi:hypothetical protein